MKNNPIAFLLFLPLVFSTPATSETSKIIDIPEAPLSIITYEAEYQEQGRYQTEGVLHSVTVKNVSDQEVVAFGIGLMAFDAFNTNMGRGITGIDMRAISVGSEISGSWTQNVRAPFTFENYGTGVAYVRKARMEDGTVWEAELEAILEELKNIENELNIEDITD